MHKVLIVDDDEATRRLLKTRLSPICEVIETGEAAQALELALAHKPGAILMDLMMPEFSGFELCQSFRDLSYTSRIPIFVVSGESDDRCKAHCERLGALDYFQKPIDFTRLQGRLLQELQTQHPERRRSARVKMKMLIRLRGTDVRGDLLNEVTSTDNVSLNGFLCECSATLSKNSLVEVFLMGTAETGRYVGRARVVRREAPDTPWQRYAFEFQEKTLEWVLQPN
jgi:response regulator RpfG family c-di-GMP phosphodiesterase